MLKRLIQTVLIETSVNGLMDHNNVNEGAVLLLLKWLQAAEGLRSAHHRFFTLSRITVSIFPSSLAAAVVCPLRGNYTF